MVNQYNSVEITEEEKAALVAFLQSLTDEEFVKTHAQRKK